MGVNTIRLSHNKYIRAFKSYGSKYGNTISLCVFLLLIFLLLSLITPIVTKIIIDDVILDKNRSLLNILLVVMLGVLIFGTVLDLAQNYIFIRVDQRIDFDIKFDFYSHILKKLPMSFLDNRKSGELQYRIMRDTDVIHQFLAATPINFFMNVIIALCIAIGMLILNWKLAAVVFTIFIGHIVAIFKFYKPIVKYSRLVKERAEHISGRMFECLSNIKMIKVSAIERAELLRFHRDLHDLVTKKIRSFMLTKGAGSTVNFINNLWAFFILYYGGNLVINGSLSLGGLMAFMMFANRLYNPISTATNIILNLQAASVSFDRFYEIYDVHSDCREEAIVPKFIDGSISFRHVSFGYYPNYFVLKDVTFDISPRSTVAFVGPSGSGKTTLCSLLSRFYEPNDGAIMVDNLNLNKIDRTFLHSQMGVVLQNTFVLSGSIEENIACGSKVSDVKEIIQAAKEAGCHDFIVSLPDRYRTQIGERGLRLSSGQAQRIAIARVFLKNPKIVIFDEATSFLDLETEAVLQRSLFRLSKNRTTLIIAHRLSTVKKADRIFVMKDGEIVETGNHGELVERNGFYTKLYRSVLSS